MGHSDRNSGWSEGGASGWAAFESFCAATHVLTADGFIVEANPAFERMFGGPREAFFGRHQADLCNGTSAERRRLTSRVLRETASRGMWEGTIESRASDGRRFRTRAHVYPTQVDGRRYFVCIQEEPGAPAHAGSFGKGAPYRRCLPAPG